MNLGDIRLNGKHYRIDTKSYRRRDVTDFSPRSGTPGGSVLFSELGLYQPQNQTDWRHGFGANWYVDAMSYMRTEGSIDTRHEGIALMFTKPTLSATTAGVGTNLLSNGTAETGDLTNWTQSGTLWSASATAPYAGTYSFKCDTVASGTETLTSDRYAAVGNRTYEITGYSKETATETSTTLNVAAADLQIYAGAPSTNYSAGVTANVGAQGTYAFRYLIKWTALSDGTIPAKAKINACAFRMKLKTDYATIAPSINVYRTKRAWFSNQATWSNYATGSAWQVKGGFGANDCEQDKIGSCDLTATETVDAFKSFTLDADKIEDFVDGTWTNNGLMLRSVGESSDRYEIYSTYTALTANAPKLDLTYTEYPDYTIAVNWYDAASAGNLIRTDTLLEQNYTSSWNQRTARAVSPTNALSFTISITNSSGTALYLDALDFHLSSGNKSGFFTWNNSLWSYGEEGLYKYANGTWASSYTTATVNAAFPYGDYLIYCPDGLRIRKLNTSGTHSDAGNDTSTTDFKGLISHAGYIYGWKDGTNQVHRDSTSDLSDMEGTTTDTNIIYVGSSNTPIIGMVEYAGYLYVARNDGLWQLGEDLIARKTLDFSSDASADNFRSMSVFNGYLLFPIRDKVYQWNGARLSDVTPPRLTDAFPYTTYGRFANFVSSGKYLYCTARTNETTYSEDLLCYDGVAWFKMARLVDSSTTDTITAMGYDPLNNYLWYNNDSTNDLTYYIPFQSQSSLPYASFSTSGTHELIFSRWDCGFRRVKKSCPSVLIEASNLSSDSYLSVSYAIDGGSWVEWGDIKTNGVTELTLPGGSNSVEFYYITFKIAFTTTDSTNTPVLEGLTMRFIMRPETSWGWSVGIPIAHDMDIGEGTEGRITKDALQDLADARDSKAPVEFVDVVGNRYFVYISSMNETLVEMDRSDMGEAPGLEYLSVINLVQVK